MSAKSVEARKIATALSWMLVGALSTVGSVGTAQRVHANDILQTDDEIPTAADGSLAQVATSCRFGRPQEPLLLSEAVERALCNNPKTRQAWVNVMEKIAGIGAARAAFLPSINGNWQGIRDDTVTRVEDHPQLGSVNRPNVQTASVSLTWMLFDFGARSASLASASALLAAARSTHDAALQNTFMSVARDFYSAQAAAGAVTAAIDIEKTANDSLRAAQMRVDKGVAPISDALQAQTAQAQAALVTIKSKGKLQIALGILASDMALPPQTSLTMPAVDAGVQPDAQFSDSIDGLIEEVRRAHPSVLAAKAQLDSAIDKAAQTRAEGLPTFGLVSKYSRNDQPASLGLGMSPVAANAREWYVGFQVTVPLFEGFGRMYRVRQAEAQVDAQRELLNEAQQQTGLDAWTAYQDLRASTDSLKSFVSLLDTARRSYSATEHRYQEGVGNILEVLNAQTDLANARQQQVQAITDWRAARLRLAGSLGRLDSGDLRSPPRLPLLPLSPLSPLSPLHHPK